MTTSGNILNYGRNSSLVPIILRKLRIYYRNIPGITARRKPELLEPATYSLVDYREAETVVADYNAITRKATEIYKKLPAEKRDAFYQLVLFPTKASALVNELYLAVAKNNLYAQQQRSSTNDMAAETQALFSADTTLMGYFNNTFAGGKWSHFMDQTHLGYISWRDPPIQQPAAYQAQTNYVPEAPEMGVTLEGSVAVWPNNQEQASLPECDVFNRQSRYIEVFNKGKAPFEFEVSSNTPWIKISDTKGIVEKDKRIWLSIDWDKIPEGRNRGVVRITGTNSEVELILTSF